MPWPIPVPYFLESGYCSLAPRVSAWYYRRSLPANELDDLARIDFPVTKTVFNSIPHFRVVMALFVHFDE